jgi:DNA-binding TFAR19-related protein (PDSD5 family)
MCTRLSCVNTCKSISNNLNLQSIIDFQCCYFLKEPPRCCEVKVQEEQQQNVEITSETEVKVEIVDTVSTTTTTETIVKVEENCQNETKIISPCQCEIIQQSSTIGKCMCEIIQEQQQQQEQQSLTFEELAADATGEPVNEKILEDELKTSEDEVSIVSSAFAEQLENVQKQLMALSHLPKTIQSTLDDITKQLQSLIPTKQKSLEPEIATNASVIVEQSTTEGKQ